LAALAGVEDLWPWTLRTLTYRRNALETSRWDRAAWIAYWAAAPHAGGRLTYDEVHPLRKHQDPRTCLTDVLSAEASWSKVLPAKISAEEREWRWKKYEETDDPKWLDVRKGT
jgi:hypothetical protein